MPKPLRKKYQLHFNKYTLKKKMARYFSCKSLEFTIFEKQNDVLWTNNLTLFSTGLICFAEMKKRVVQRKAIFKTNT